MTSKSAHLSFWVSLVLSFLLSIAVAAPAYPASAASVKESPIPSGAQDAPMPQLRKQSTDAAGFVPSGWVLEKSVKGDLNADGIEDLVLILREADPQKVITYKSEVWVEPDNPNVIDTNRRILVVAFGTGTPSGYTQVLVDAILIPPEEPEHPNEQPGLPYDPLRDISITRNALRISIRSASERDWGGGFTMYTFRYETGCFRLIGLDEQNFPSCKGCDPEARYSANFLTRRLKDVSAHGNVKWSNLPDYGRVCLHDVTAFLGSAAWLKR
jgi:hypothetical protein